MANAMKFSRNCCPICGSNIGSNEKYCSDYCRNSRGKIGVDEIYDFICNYKKNHDGNSPTVRLIQNELDYSSPSIVFNRLKVLEQNKKIVVNNGRIELIGGQYLPPFPLKK